MKLVRFEVSGTAHNGVLDRDNIYENHYSEIYTYSADKVKLLPPVSPSKIVCVGLNYREHAHEMGVVPEPVLFMKPPSAIIGPNDYIIKPDICERLDYEGELAVVIKDDIKNIKPESVFEHILGYTCALDVTARDLQNKDGQWTRAKSFDTFLPIGPWIETDVDPTNLELKLFLNNELKQNGNTRDMIYGVDKLVSFISSCMTLKSGDVILTGTPSGIGPMQSGDVVRFSIKGIGTLVNYVK